MSQLEMILRGLGLVELALVAAILLHAGAITRRAAPFAVSLPSC
jgi:hypothetical protein